MKGKMQVEGLFFREFFDKYRPLRAEYDSYSTSPHGPFFSIKLIRPFAPYLSSKISDFGLLTHLILD